MLSKTLTEVLESGVWGTIGPYSRSGARALADFCGAGYCLLTHSASAAYESVLRSLELAHGDLIITSSLSNPMLSLVAVCMGAAPLFCDIEPETVIFSADSLGKMLNGTDISHIKAVAVDIIGGFCPDLDAINNICKVYKLPFILNAGDAFNLLYNGEPFTKFADAVIYNLNETSALNIGNGGAVLTDNADIFAAAFAFHHCGANAGVNSTVNLNAIVGGDFRIAEWQACLISGKISQAANIIKNRAKAAADAISKLSCDYLVPVNEDKLSSHNTVIFRYISEKNGGTGVCDFIAGMNDQGIMLHQSYTAMHRQPVFKSEYFYKMTGFNGCYSDEKYVNSIDAEEKFLWLDI